MGHEMGPQRLWRHPEDASRVVLGGILRIGALHLLGNEAGMLVLKGIRNVLEENQSEDDLLVICNDVHGAEQHVRDSRKMAPKVVFDR